MTPSPTLTNDSIVAAVSDQLTCQLGGEAAVLHLLDGTYYGLNETGAFLWERLQKPVRVRDLREALLQEFSVAEEEADGDLLGLLKDLMQARLVETRDA